MSMEHLNERGELCQGYFCMQCGKGGLGMYGHRGEDCITNPKLVKKLVAMNKAGSIEQYTFNLLQETKNA